MIRPLFFYLLLLIGNLIHAQSTDSISSRNGYKKPVHDTLRLLYVFAEAVDDPNDVHWQHPNWQEGTLPKNAGEWYNADLKEGDTLTGITKYYHQASFGKFVLLGDYPDLVQIPYDSISGDGSWNVINYLNDKVPGDDLVTQRGKSVSKGDFDKWTTSLGQPGKHKVKEQDGFIDLLAIIWRVNSKYRDNSGTGGAIYMNKYKRPIKDAKGFAGYTRMMNKDAFHMGNFRHEYGHALLGGNNFHTGLGAGTRKTMHLSPGYSILTDAYSYEQSFTAWDRHRLGWKPDSHRYFISARNLDYKEISSDFAYDINREPDTILLRDFVTYGDAIRIELPYLKADTSAVYKQYLWLENHQMVAGEIDLGNPRLDDTGMYAYIQIGKDDTTEFRAEENGFLKMLSAHGNYDFQEGLANRTYNVQDEYANPLTGTNILEAVLNDYDPKNGRLQHKEYTDANRVVVNGDTLTDERFSYETYPRFGSELDVFRVGDAIRIDGNPSPVPYLTLEATYRNFNKHRSTPAFENRHVYLNGISVEILEEVPNRHGHGKDLKVVIKWNDLNIHRDVRWCGPIELMDSLTVKAGSHILLDQGLTATRYIDPLEFQGEQVFADPTTLTIRYGAKMVMENNARITIANGSTLHLKAGGQLALQDSAAIIIDSSSTLLLDETDHINLRDKASSIIVKPGGTIRTAQGAGLTFTGRGYLELNRGARIHLGEGVELRVPGPNREE